MKTVIIVTLYVVTICVGVFIGLKMLKIIPHRSVEASQQLVDNASNKSVGHIPMAISERIDHKYGSIQ